MLSKVFDDCIHIMETLHIIMGQIGAHSRKVPAPTIALSIHPWRQPQRVGCGKAQMFIISSSVNELHTMHDAEQAPGAQPCVVLRGYGVIWTRAFGVAKQKIASQPEQTYPKHMVWAL